MRMDEYKRMLDQFKSELQGKRKKEFEENREWSKKE